MAMTRFLLLAALALTPALRAEAQFGPVLQGNVFPSGPSCSGADCAAQGLDPLTGTSAYDGSLQALTDGCTPWHPPCSLPEERLEPKKTDGVIPNEGGYGFTKDGIIDSKGGKVDCASGSSLPCIAPGLQKEAISRSRARNKADINPDTGIAARAVDPGLIDQIVANSPAFNPAGPGPKSEPAGGWGGLGALGTVLTNPGGEVVAGPGGSAFMGLGPKMSAAEQLARYRAPSADESLMTRILKSIGFFDGGAPAAQPTANFGPGYKNTRTFGSSGPSKDAPKE